MEIQRKHISSQKLIFYGNAKRCVMFSWYNVGYKLITAIKKTYLNLNKNMAILNQTLEKDESTATF